ncbi:uncharacterized protein LOC127777639 [Oryza glaberrima]|uniref:Uncharacterized protein n=1 Tax=Oryza glaberrima TaxID=4538 RepID=I1Q3B8_ORYGL|nr:uncharacterized protein LOC127777639 [Oryza glaberrima]
MATFAGRTSLLATLVVVVSAVIMACSVDVCHGAREGAFSRPDPAPADHRPKDDDVYVPGGGGEGGYGPRGPCYDPLIPGHGGGLIPIRPDLPAPGYGRGRYPCFRPLPYHPTPPLPPPQNGDTPPP